MAGEKIFGAYFPKHEYEARWAAVHSVMATKGYDAAVIWGRSGGTYERHGDIVYLLNYYSNQSGQIWDSFHEDLNAAAISAVILRPGEKPELIADEPWPRQHLIPTDRIAWDFDTIATMVASLKAHGPRGRIAISGSDFLGFKYWEQITAATPDIEWVVDDTLVSDIRIIKSPREHEAFREGGEIVTRALNAVFEALLGGKSEQEAAGVGAREVFRSGGQVHMIPISSGENIGYFTSQPIPGYSAATPEDGDLARAWVYGPMFEGYWLDPGRTTVIGLKPTNSQRHLVESTASFVEKLRRMIKPGVTVAEILALGDKLHEELGGIKDQAALKWPLYGHGNGLFWDEPVLSHGYKGKHQVIREGMVMSTETFMALEGVGSAGFEQNFIVTADGTELLTHTPLSWW